MNYPLRIPNNCYIHVKDDVIVGTPFTLPQDYLTESGDKVSNIQTLPDKEKEKYGLYPVVETVYNYDSRYQYCEPVFRFDTESKKVSLGYVIKNIDINELKERVIEKAYNCCKETLDELAKGYSHVEVASFPILQQEILEFNKSSSVGPLMQSIIRRSRHTASSLSLSLTAKIVKQQQALQLRDDRLLNVNKITSLAQLVMCLEEM
jgi:hypothetical protein